jgi:hypothetical protein
LDPAQSSALLQSSTPPRTAVILNGLLFINYRLFFKRLLFLNRPFLLKRPPVLNCPLFSKQPLWHKWSSLPELLLSFPLFPTYLSYTLPRLTNLCRSDSE